MFGQRPEEASKKNSSIGDGDQKEQRQIFKVEDGARARLALPLLCLFSVSLSLAAFRSRTIFARSVSCLLFPFYVSIYVEKWDSRLSIIFLVF